MLPLSVWMYVLMCVSAAVPVFQDIAGCSSGFKEFLKASVLRAAGVSLVSSGALNLFIQNIILARSSDDFFKHNYRYQGNRTLPCGTHPRLPKAGRKGQGWESAAQGSFTT